MLNATGIRSFAAGMLILACVLFTADHVAARATDASISGTALAGDGGPLAGARITVRNASTGFSPYLRPAVDRCERGGLTRAMLCCNLSILLLN